CKTFLERKDFWPRNVNCPPVEFISVPAGKRCKRPEDARCKTRAVVDLVNQGHLSWNKHTTLSRTDMRDSHLLELCNEKILDSRVRCHKKFIIHIFQRL